jgi:hypothetical protein
MESTRQMAENDPNIQKIKRVPVGNHVLYHGRNGAMRQGRTEFPATVLKQHEDDGSLDLIIDYEAEDRIWEQRVREWSETQPNHCWEEIEEIESDLIREAIDAMQASLEILVQQHKAIMDLIHGLKKQMYGDYEAPSRSMIEYLDDFDKRLKKLEKR